MRKSDYFKKLVQGIGGLALFAAVTSGEAHASTPDLCIQENTPEKQMKSTILGVRELLKEMRKQAGVNYFSEIPNVRDRCENLCKVDCSQNISVESNVSLELIPSNERSGKEGGVLDIDFCRIACTQLIEGNAPHDTNPKPDKTPKKDPKRKPSNENGGGSEEEVCKDLPAANDYDSKQVRNEKGEITGFYVYDKVNCKWEFYSHITDEGFGAVLADSGDCCEEVREQLGNIITKQKAHFDQGAQCEEGKEGENNKLNFPAGIIALGMVFAAALAGRSKKNKDGENKDETPRRK